MKNQIETVNIVLTKGGFFYSLISFSKENEQIAKDKYIELIQNTLNYTLEEDDIFDIFEDDSYELDSENTVQLVYSQNSLDD